jgi:hydrogenase maturation protease
MGARVIGIGQPAAGDDGVGIAVLRHLREQGGLDGADLVEAAEPSALIPWLEGADPVVLVDAVLGGGAPGDVLRLTPESLAGAGVQPLSTHGMGVAQAVELARTLAPDTSARRIWIVGVCIARPERYAHALSVEVERAVPRAAAEVASLLRGE